MAFDASTRRGELPRDEAGTSSGVSVRRSRAEPLFLDTGAV